MLLLVARNWEWFGVGQRPYAMDLLHGTLEDRREIDQSRFVNNVDIQFPNFYFYAIFLLLEFERCLRSRIWRKAILRISFIVKCQRIREFCCPLESETL